MGGVKHGAAKVPLWRLSLVLATALIGFSIWLVYEVQATARAFRGMAEAFGGEAKVDWGGIIVLFGPIGLVGVLLPGLYVRWAWARAFPQRSSPASH